MAEPPCTSKGTGHVFETLPSGKRVPITLRADPFRPWHVRGSGTTCQVVRARRGDSSEVEVYSAGRVRPVTLGEPDAKALADVLNATRESPRSVARSKAASDRNPRSLGDAETVS